MKKILLIILLSLLNIQNSFAGQFNSPIDTTRDKNIILQDSANVDAFGRLRTSEAFTNFEATHQYGILPEDWRSSVTGSATVTADTNQSAAVLTTTTVSGDKAIHQTLLPTHYAPGKSLSIDMTGIIGTAKTNVRKRLGYFDENNGIFFEQTISAFSIVARSNVSGSVVDTAIAQANWNIDKFDGTGPCKITLDVIKIQIFHMDMQWLGAGRVRVGFNIGGKLCYAHEFLHANLDTTIYARTIDLFGRYEIENTGTAASSTTLLSMCFTSSNESGFDQRAILFSASNGATTISITTRRPVLSIRAKTTLNSLPNHGIIAPEDYAFIVTGNSAIFWEIIYNATTLTGASFTSVDTNSITEFDIAATAIVGGTVKRSGFISAVNNGSIVVNLKAIQRVLLSTSIAAAAGDTLSIVFTSMNAATASAAAITWTEIR